MLAVPAGDKTGMVGQYMMEKIPGFKLEDGMFTAFAFLSDKNEFVGACTVSNFRQTDCEIACAAETPTVFRPHIMRAVFTYIFEQLKCVRCTSITTKTNKRARDFLTALGFELEGNIRLGYDGRRDALIYGLLASDCRFLAGGLNGEEVGASSPNAA
jgi:RimJ/RimL family protein N-acetyltransferase